MDTAKRITLKAITWQITGFLVMMLVGFGVTGSLAASGGIAGATTATGFVGYFLHEWLWSRVAWGRRPG